LYFIYIVIHLFSVMEVVTLEIWMSFLNTIVEAGIFCLFWVFCNSSARYHNWILDFLDFELSGFCFFEILSFSRFWVFWDSELSGFSAFEILCFRDFVTCLPELPKSPMTESRTTKYRKTVTLQMRGKIFSIITFLNSHQYLMDKNKKI
jgi:hypothetical protein